MRRYDRTFPPSSPNSALLITPRLTIALHCGMIFQHLPLVDESDQVCRGVAGPGDFRLEITDRGLPRRLHLEGRRARCGLDPEGDLRHGVTGPATEGPKDEKWRCGGGAWRDFGAEGASPEIVVPLPPCRHLQRILTPSDPQALALPRIHRAYAHSVRRKLHVGQWQIA